MRARAGRRRSPEPTPRERDDRLRTRLAAEGLGPEPGLTPGRRRGSAVTDPVDLARRLRRALATLDPVSRAFGRRLATRVDLLPPAACRELALLPAGGEPLGPEAFRSALEGTLEAELGRPVARCFAEVDPRPLAVGAFRQRHRARTVGGREVEVVLARPEAAARAASGHLEPLGAVLDAAGLPGAEVVADFAHFAAASVDLGSEAAALFDLAADAEAFEPLVSPVVDRELSGASVLVHEALPVPAVPPGEADLRRLLLVWLRQVLFGRVVPLDPLAPGDGGPRLSADGRIALVSGPFARPTAAFQAHLWTYLGAAVDEDPSSASEHLLPELVATSGVARDPDSADLLRRLRQVVPFRDGSLGPGADPVADHLCAALRVARQRGFRARRPLGDFVQGLVPLALRGTETAPGGEPVRGALEELRLLRTASDLRRALDPAEWAGVPAPAARALLELPRKMDAVLDVLARGEARVRLEVEAPGRPRGLGAAASVALAAAVGAVVIATPRLVELTTGGSGTVPLILLAAALAASLLWRR